MSPGGGTITQRNSFSSGLQYQLHTTGNTNTSVRCKFNVCNFWINFSFSADTDFGVKVNDVQVRRSPSWMSKPPFKI